MVPGVLTVFYAIDFLNLNYSKIFKLSIIYSLHRFQRLHLYMRLLFLHYMSIYDSLLNMEDERNVCDASSVFLPEYFREM